MDDIVDVVQFEIARELIIESGGSGSDEQTKVLLAVAKGNPMGLRSPVCVINASKERISKINGDVV